MNYLMGTTSSQTHRVQTLPLVIPITSVKCLQTMSIELCFVKSNAYGARVVRMPIPSCHHLDKKRRITLTIACVAGAERGGKREEIIRKCEQRAYFGRILLSPGDCKNRDWSQLLICQSRAQSNTLIGHN